jgi:hypothetical protein
MSGAAGKRALAVTAKALMAPLRTGGKAFAACGADTRSE